MRTFDYPIGGATLPWLSKVEVDPLLPRGTGKLVIDDGRVVAIIFGMRYYSGVPIPQQNGADAKKPEVKKPEPSKQFISVGAVLTTRAGTKISVSEINYNTRVAKVKINSQKEHEVKLEDLEQELK